MIREHAARRRGRAGRSCSTAARTWTSSAIATLLEGWQRDAAYPVTYIPTISRPDDPRNAGWTGRTGGAEAWSATCAADLRLRPDQTVVYICGNPDMILNVEAIADGRGFPEFHVKKELYWPKGKDGPGRRGPSVAGAGAGRPPARSPGLADRSARSWHRRRGPPAL